MEKSRIEVKLNGISDIMFDKFIDHSKEQRPPEQKLYLDDKNNIVLPSENLYSFLFGELAPQGCAKTFEGRKGKNYCRIGVSHIFIDPLIIPFQAGEKNIIFNGFKDKKFWIHEGAPRTRGPGGSSIKQETKKRPVLKLPWSISFEITIIKNDLIDEGKLYNWFVLGGMQITIGTYRPRFGRFEVDVWNVN